MPLKNYPSTFAPSIEPFEGEWLSADDQAAVNRLAEQGYKVYVGLTAEYADAVKAMSLDPEILKYCPRDSTERFSDRVATERWLGKQRAMFLLIKNENNQDRLAGYGWTGPETSDKIPGGQTTFAVRIGPDDRGKGLSTPFSKLIVDGSALLYDSRDYWLETWASDAAAVHIYHKNGFVDVAQIDDRRPTETGGTLADSRLYMALDNGLLPRG